MANKFKLATTIPNDWRAEEPGSKSGKLVVNGFEAKAVLAPVGAQQ